MGDFKLYTTTPAIGNIKLGSTNVSSIYFGSELVWPQTAPIDSGIGDFVTIVRGATFQPNQLRLYDKNFVDKGLLALTERIRYNISDDTRVIVLYNSDSTSPPDAATINVSTDYGETFTTDGVVRNITAMSSSGDCQYLYYVSAFAQPQSLLFKSSNNGTTFNEISLLNRAGSRNNDSDDTSVDLPVVSKNGRYILVVWRGEYPNSSSQLYTASFSDDFGVTFTDITTRILGEGAGQAFSLLSSQAISGDGRYIYILSYGTSTSCTLYKSTDFGQTWTSSVKQIATCEYIESSYTGQHLVFTSGAYGKVYVSNDYGATFQEKFSGSQYWASNISDSGQYIMTENFIGMKKMSSDYGQTWQTGTLPNTWYSSQILG